ncbi:hypothetical protein MMC30_001600 [Trapelia coarctata]|nr:hypothetical protein [Trapelia coarctata]
MAPRDKLTLPTLSALPSSNRLPATHPAASRTLSRLSRPALLTLVQEWLKTSNQTTCAPYLGGGETEEDTTYSVARSLEELREAYRELQERKGGKKEIVERILEGDWRHGVSLRQLAMADAQYLLDHPTSQRWAALKLVRVSTTAEGDTERPLPRFHAPTFLRNLQQEIGSMAKAHYNLTRMASLPIILLRICIYESPYSSQVSMTKKASTQILGASTTLYLAFPDNTPCVYVSLAGSAGQSNSGDGKSLRKLVIDALPKAFSRPRERYALKPTSLSAKSLAALVALRGPGRSNAAAGGWSIFADGTIEQSPLTGSAPASTWMPNNNEDKENAGITGQDKGSQKRRNVFDEEAEKQQKKRRLIAQARFGPTHPKDSSACIERLEAQLEDPFSRSADAEEDELSAMPATTAPIARKGRRSTISILEDSTEDHTNEEEPESSKGWAPNVQMVFSGTDIFSGIRKLVESGAIDGKKMPGWMTGENAVSIGVVRNGRIRGNKGSGF